MGMGARMVSSVKLLPNHYETLGLSPAASEREIAGAFARAMNMFGARSLAGAAQIGVAFEVLRNPAKRSDYDRSLGLTSELQPRQWICSFEGAEQKRIDGVGMDANWRSRLLVIIPLFHLGSRACKTAWKKEQNPRSLPSSRRHCASRLSRQFWSLPRAPLRMKRRDRRRARAPRRAATRSPQCARGKSFRRRSPNARMEAAGSGISGPRSGCRNHRHPAGLWVHGDSDRSPQPEAAVTMALPKSQTNPVIAAPPEVHALQPKPERRFAAAGTCQDYGAEPADCCSRPTRRSVGAGSRSQSSHRDSFERPDSGGCRPAVRTGSRPGSCRRIDASAKGNDCADDRKDRLFVRSQLIPSPASRAPRLASSK